MSENILEKSTDHISNGIKENCFREGMRDGIPVALGYFAVAFSLGIYARSGGITAFQGFLASMLVYASAGEYAGFTVMAEKGSLITMVIACVVINARYALMGFSLGQRVAPGTPFWRRILIGTAVTDEIFGITIARSGPVRASYMYGAFLVAIPAWALGTAVGIQIGTILPQLVVNGLGVALYGMFLAIILPKARTDRAVALAIIVSFAASGLSTIAPVISGLSSGNRVILLTILISAIFAVIRPVKEEQ